VTSRASELLMPRILLVDDERQIHSSVRLRLGKNCVLTCCSDAREALTKVGTDQFDLCFADIHMPHMDGLKFIEAAQKVDPQLGYVILSAFDNDTNLRRSIPLQVYDFIPKPLPDRDGFEDRIGEWVDRTRLRRREHGLVKNADTLATDLHTARLEREVEIIASETARDALLQTSNLLSTVHAHLVLGSTLLAPRARTDPTLAQLLRGLDEARKTAEAAMTVGDAFFGSAYGHRDTSPAFVGPGLRHAAGIATRMCHAAETQKAIDITSIDERLPLRHLSGIDFLLMIVPVLAAALTVADAGTTVRVSGGQLARLDAVLNDSRLRPYLWVNRRSAITSQPGTRLEISVGAPPFLRGQAEAWLASNYAPLAAITARGLILGLQKCKGLLALAVAPESSQFSIVLALPV
jgi:CheY-like chemotaxis protein